MMAHSHFTATWQWLSKPGALNEWQWCCRAHREAQSRWIQAGWRGMWTSVVALREWQYPFISRRESEDRTRKKKNGLSFFVYYLTILVPFGMFVSAQEPLQNKKKGILCECTGTGIIPFMDPDSKYETGCFSWQLSLITTFACCSDEMCWNHAPQNMSSDLPLI